MKISKISVSLWPGIGAIILFPFITLPIYALGMRDSGLILVMVFIVPLLAAGTVCGFYEKESWDRKTGHFICSFLLVIAVVMLVFSLLRDRYGITRMLLIAVLPPAIMIGFFAGFIAGRIKIEKSKPKWTHLLICWLLGPVWIGLCCVFTLLGKAILYGPLETDKIAQLATAALSLPFGPYTTFAAKLGQWPNAGEFFSLWLAVLITTLLLLSASGYLIAKSRTAAGSMLIVFATTASASVIIGVAQLLNCTS
jgi:hypothetical protein